jgi:hypothetical protein
MKSARLFSATLATRKSPGSRRTDGFATAYNAALQTATMAIACTGYRVTAKAGHHRVTIDAITLAVGNSGQRYADYLETCRRKRNVIDYTRAQVATDSEAEKSSRWRRRSTSSSRAGLRPSFQA